MFYSTTHPSNVVLSNRNALCPVMSVLLGAFILATGLLQTKAIGASIFGATASADGPINGALGNVIGAPDHAFIQIDSGTTVTVNFATGLAAYSDGTSAPDLRIHTFDNLAVVNGEISASHDGIHFTTLGVFSDSHPPDNILNIDLDAFGISSATAVRIKDVSGTPSGFDLDSVEGLRSSGHAANTPDTQGCLLLLSTSIAALLTQRIRCGASR